MQLDVQSTPSERPAMLDRNCESTRGYATPYVDCDDCIREAARKIAGGETPGGWVGCRLSVNNEEGSGGRGEERGDDQGG